LLQVSELSVRYRTADGAEHTALENVSFALGDGEVVGVLGESGCGKTTLCLALMGLLPAAARVLGGSIRCNGRELLSLTEKEMQKARGAELSMVFQEPALSLNPVMRAGDQIAEVLRAHTSLDGAQRRKRVEELLSEVQLEPVGRIYRSYPHELSGGQQQRVAMAQALACRPKLMVADEPTASLDLTTQAEILALMRGLRARYGTSLLVVSHSPAVLAALADRVIVLLGGSIVEQGRSTEVLRTPQHEYTARLLRPFEATVLGAQAR